MKLCILGGGLSGLLVTKHVMNIHNVDLYEKTYRLGGNNYSSNEKIPFRYGVFLESYSPCLLKILKELHLDYINTNLDRFKTTYNDRVTIMPTGINGIHKFSQMNNLIKYTYTTIINLCIIWYLYYFTKYYSINSTIDSFDLKDNLYKNIIVPLGGINMFVDKKDFNKLPSRMVARYILLGLTDSFVAIKGGNHKLIDRLVEKIKPNSNIYLKNSITKIEIVTDNNILVNYKKLYNSIVITCQPHEAKSILPENLEPHQSIIKCFETVDCFSCIHTYSKMFDKDDKGMTLVYNTIQNHHYLHIDAYFYNINGIHKPRQRIISYWYDKSPNIIPNKFIIKESHTKLSRLKLDKKDILNTLLEDLKKNHQNVYLSNAAYYGFMWHEDACCMAETVASAFR